MSTKQVTDEITVDAVSDDKMPGEDDGSRVGPPITISHGLDRYWAGFANPLTLPVSCRG